MKHLFWDCLTVKKLWTAVSKWLSFLIKEKTNLKYADIILNNYKGLVNIILLTVKRHIYVVRCKNQLPTFQNFLNLINHVQKTEYVTAISKDKVRVHLKKWTPYIEFM